MIKKKRRVAPEERQIETAEVKILGRKIEIILPNAKFIEKRDGFFAYNIDFPLSPYDHQIGFIESREFNDTLSEGYSPYKLHNLRKNGFRHISLTELIQVLSGQSDLSGETYCRIMKALIMSGGYSTSEDTRIGHWGIYVDDGIRVENTEAIIFKGISGKLEWYKGEILNPMWNSSYHLKKDCNIPNQKFSVKRLFRKKLQDELKTRPLTLKDIYDTNPDLVEYLFEQEFSDLPKNIQHMSIRFPLGNKEERKHEKKRGLFVMPMAMLYQTHMWLDSYSRDRNVLDEYCQSIEGFEIEPNGLSMPANYCNDMLPRVIHHWGVKGKR